MISYLVWHFFSFILDDILSQTFLSSQHSQVVLALIKMTPKIPWGKSVGRGGSGSTPEDLNPFEDASCDNENEMDVSASSPVMESVQNSSYKRRSIGSTGNKKERENEEDKLCTPYICVVAALQRMTLTVPDKATSRSLILSSIILVLSSLHENKADINVNKRDDRYNVSTCIAARCRVIYKRLLHRILLNQNNSLIYINQSSHQNFSSISITSHTLIISHSLTEETLSSISITIIYFSGTPGFLPPSPSSCHKIFNVPANTVQIE